jgi:hypothetical protein
MVHKMYIICLSEERRDKTGLDLCIETEPNQTKVSTRPLPCAQLQENICEFLRYRCHLFTYLQALCHSMLHSTCDITGRL